MWHDILESLESTNGILLITAAIICSIAFVPSLWYFIRSPGPWGVPLLGYLPFLREDFYIQLHELAKEHGEVYLINVAGQTYVHLDSLRAVREVHVNKAEFFSSRSKKYSLFQYVFENSLIMLNGESWKIQRKFFAQSLKEIGLHPNKEELIGPIGDAVRSTIHALHETKGEPVDVNALLTKECTSTVVRLFLGDDVSEEYAKRINDAYLKVLPSIFTVNSLLTGTFARYFLFPRISGYKEMIEGKKEMENLLAKVVAEHKIHFDLDQEPRDLVDLYLREKTLREKKGDPHAKHFTESILVATLLQVYGDGSLGVGLLMFLLLQHLSFYRDTQDDLYKEITKEIGTERLPTWADRTKLPLMHSTIKELLRMSKFLTLFPDSECTKETSILGVRVPEGSITLLSFWGVFHDPKVYENPYKFNPARFLPGPLKEEDPILFGIGKRSCIGEALVMGELFTFLASLLQNFLFLPETKEIRKLGDDINVFEELDQSRLRAIPRSMAKPT